VKPVSTLWNARGGLVAVFDVVAVFAGPASGADGPNWEAEPLGVKCS